MPTVASDRTQRKGKRLDPKVIALINRRLKKRT